MLDKRIQEKGLRYFQDQQKLDDWMNSKIVVLGYKTPKQVAETEEGIKQVLDELTRLIEKHS